MKYKLLKNHNMKTTKQKTAVVTFKTTPQNKEALVNAAKAAGMDTSPYIDDQLRLLSELFASEGVKTLLGARKSQGANFLSKEGKRVYIKLDSNSDVLKYYIALEQSYKLIMFRLINEGRNLFSFASEEEKAKITKEEEEKQKIALNNDVPNQNPPKSI